MFPMKFFSDDEGLGIISQTTKLCVAEGGFFLRKIKRKKSSSVARLSTGSINVDHLGYWILQFPVSTRKSGTILSIRDTSLDVGNALEWYRR